MPGSVPEELDAHYTALISLILEGEVVPFLGAGANLCGRPAGASFTPEGEYLPSGTELAQFLAEKWGFPDSNQPLSLARVAQYLDVSLGPGRLYKALRHVFEREYPGTPLHRFLATLRRTLAEKGYEPAGQLIVSTNYDDVLERAFEAEEEPFDLVTYLRLPNDDDDDPYRLVHVSFDGKAYRDPVVVGTPNAYTGLERRPDGKLARTGILKLHGAIDRLHEPPMDRYVITEDDYMEYPTPNELSDWVPSAFARQLSESNLLFLGYSLGDWNLRVILHRMWRAQALSYGAWAIQRRPDKIDRRFWQKRNVEILEVELSDYVSGLLRRMQEIPARSVAL